MDGVELCRNDSYAVHTSTCGARPSRELAPNRPPPMRIGHNFGHSLEILSGGSFLNSPVGSPPRLTGTKRIASRKPLFSHPDWLFDIKHDGFRVLLYSDNYKVRPRL